MKTISKTQKHHTFSTKNDSQSFFDLFESHQTQRKKHTHTPNTIWKHFGGDHEERRRRNDDCGCPVFKLKLESRCVPQTGTYQPSITKELGR